ncbi:MFS transporter [Clostridium autoethanogenum]|uniref:MFS transporter n=1 Tax=Clostridium autoethanogenum DSM 10061 TaxID=1341692 RepID=A0ABM5NYU3_9CLOT|nr:MFS transporter [Clostridium autoethanogenum]AGY77791.1 MFS transporter [Clostridium autoethanogenum DSM 10061]ALU37926.1 Major facilitator superfamily MFS_1 [Clostridium autoethanogenum DSM 10061]OVY49723.1 Hexuronate transporter [Clostridium autoethanogenum]
MEYKGDKSKTNPTSEEKNVKKIGWIIISFLFFFQFLNVADKMIIGLVSVPIMHEYHLSPAQWGLVGSAFFWLYSLSSVSGGILADKLGTKRVISWMCAAWTLIQFATIFAVNFSYLLITRIILGAAEGPNQAVTMTMVAKSVPKRRLGLASSIPLIGGNLGAIVMAPICGILIAWFGWRSVFLLTGICCFLWWILWEVFTKKFTEVRESKQDKQNIDKMTWKETFKVILSRNVLLVALAGFFGNYWYYSILMVWMPNYMQTIRGVSASVMAFPIMTILIAQFGLSMLSDEIYKNTGDVKKARVSVISICMICAGISVYLMTITRSNALAVVFMCLGALGLVWATHAPAIIMQYTDPKHHAKTVGMVMSIATLAGTISPILVGILIQSAPTALLGYQKTFWLTSGLYVIFGILLWIGIKPTKSLPLQTE